MVKLELSSLNCNGEKDKKNIQSSEMGTIFAWDSCAKYEFKTSKNNNVVHDNHQNIERILKLSKNYSISAFEFNCTLFF